jgi:hypothetical protein
MSNIIGIFNPYGLIQKAGKRRRTYRKKRSSRRKTRKQRR